MIITFNAKIVDFGTKEGKKGVYYKILAVQDGDPIEMYSKKPAVITDKPVMVTAKLNKFNGQINGIEYMSQV